MAAVGAEAVHAATGTFVVLFVLQVICIQELAALAICGVHEATGVGPPRVVVHVVVVYPLAAVGPDAVQVPA